MKLVVAVTGASGSVLARKLLENLGDHETHLIITKAAVEVAGYEGVDVSELKSLATRVYSDDDMASSLSSSSNLVDAMVVLPCSMKTLSALACGYADSLVVRCAENVLKTGSRLVVVPRETPLSLSAIENMRTLKLAGALLVPANVGYYTMPRTIEDVTSFICGKVLDCLRIEHSLYPRWGSG